MTVKCPICETAIAKPESTQSLPSEVSVQGEEGATALISIYKCECGRIFTTIDYEHKAVSRLSETWSFAQMEEIRKEKET